MDISGLLTQDNVPQADFFPEQWFQKTSTIKHPVHRVHKSKAHLQWMVGLQTVVKEAHPRTVIAKLGFILHRGFREIDLKVKCL